MGKGIKMIAQDCDPTMGQDRSLPYTAFLVEYLQDGMTKFDIVTAAKQVDIFDHYWDQYKENFTTFNQTVGTKNPRLWEDPQKPKPKKS